MLSVSVFPQAPSSPNHNPSRRRRWPEGSGGRAKQQDLNTACSMSPALRPFQVAFRSGIEKVALVAGPAGARLGAGWRVPGPPLGLGSPPSWGWRSKRVIRPPSPTPADRSRVSVPPGESRRWEEGEDPHPAAPTRPPPAAAAVAMRCCETPVNKPCLDSEARAQGLFA